MWQGFLYVSDDFHIYLDVFVDLGRVNIEMNDFGLFGVCIGVTGYAIIKAHANGNENVAFVDFHIRTDVSVHAEHPLIQWME
jgi:hypothetical protein